MAIFLRAVALLIGFANATAFMLITSSRELLGDWAAPYAPWAYKATFALFGALAGFLIAEILLRLARRTLRGNLLVRYAAMTLAVCIGGTLTVALLPVANLLFFLDPNAGTFSGNSAAALILRGIFVIPFGTLLGFVEGMILAFPLAAVLGLFRDRQ